MKTVPKTPLEAQAAFYKRKMMVSRTLGVLCCLLAIASIITFYFKFINEWLSLITISYSVATIFTANSFLQDVKVGNPWQRINGACAILVYILTVFLIVWGFVHGHLTLQF